MEFIKSDTNFNFIGRRKIAFVVSLFMILVSIGSLISKGGPLYGVDFAGGTLIQIKLPNATPVDTIKNGMRKTGIDISSVQQFGEVADHEYLIRTNQPLDKAEGFESEIKKSLTASTGHEPEIQRIEMVGPQVGKDLREKALFAMFYALLFITIYISGRFEQKWSLSAIMTVGLIGAVYVLSIFNVSIPILITAALFVALVLFWFLELKYAMGAIVALIHDVTITVGIFSIMDKEFTLPIIAALLTIIGYSLNDTIIVYDRIRENLKKNHRNRLDVNINKSINETLSRTILTSTTTLVVVVTLLMFGGGIIHDFAFAMTVGILVGTYSSIFVASPVLLAWQGKK